MSAIHGPETPDAARIHSRAGALNPRAHFFGDSFTAGQGDPEGVGWVGRLAAKMPKIDFANHGVPGAPGSFIVKQWLATELDPTRRELVVFCFGTNDALLGVSEDHTLLMLENALDRAEFEHLPAFVIGPPPIGDDSTADHELANLSSMMEMTVTMRGMPFIGTHAALGPGSTWHAEASAADGTHPGAGGYAELAELLRTSGLTAWLLAMSSR